MILSNHGTVSMSLDRVFFKVLLKLVGHLLQSPE